MWPSIFFSKPASYSLPLCPLVSLMKPKSPQPLCNVSPPGSDWVPLPPLGPWDSRQARLCLSTLSPRRPSSLTSHNSVSPGPWLTPPGGCHSQTSRSFPLSWLTVTLTSVTPATLLGDSEVQGDPASALALSTWPWFTAFLSTQLLSAGHTPGTVLLPTQHCRTGASPPTIQPSSWSHTGHHPNCVHISQRTDPVNAPNPLLLPHGLVFTCQNPNLVKYGSSTSHLNR